MADYQVRVAAGEAPPERVFVELSRERGFVNHGRTGSGHLVRIDEPADFGGEGDAADPAELLLAAVGASLSVTITAHAALRGLRIEGLDMRISAWMDPAAFFEFGGEARGGIRDLRIGLRMRSSEPANVLGKLVDQAAGASPVVTSLAIAPAIELELEPTA
ncbi:OsmC family protein [Novosphingobium sp. Gsoil 351]|uniref:OsmC family protein n=1 Tax=Novosphingobium sp. Gsoil 351 TaxID=2675225 RepID=UPI0018A83D72|nr:OsmC family protein [Novosphingobium sp. Gsoil 351]